MRNLANKRLRYTNENKPMPMRLPAAICQNMLFSSLLEI